MRIGGIAAHARAGAALAVAGLCAGSVAMRAQALPEPELQSLYGRCVAAMQAETCTVAIAEPAPRAALASAAGAVLVAGVGRVDAAAYRRLNAAGGAMCAQARAACTAAADGAVCRTARALWP